MSVLVLNAGYEPLHRVSLKHAVKMLVREVAVVHEPDGDATIGDYIRPRVVRLVRYVVMKWRYSRPPRWSNRNVLIRDGRGCAYCGAHAATVDHIIPVSRGGNRTDWLNTVACCGTCNSRKGNKLLGEVDMRLLIAPRVPTWDELHARAA